MNLHKQIMEIVVRERIVTTSDVSNELKISWNTADSYLKELLIEKKVERIKKKGVTLWIKK